MVLLRDRSSIKGKGPLFFKISFQYFNIYFPFVKISFRLFNSFIIFVSSNLSNGFNIQQVSKKQNPAGSTPFRPFMNPPQTLPGTLFGPFLDYFRTLLGPFLDPFWTLPGPSWTLPGPFLEHSWTLPGHFLDPS